MWVVDEIQEEGFRILYVILHIPVHSQRCLLAILVSVEATLVASMKKGHPEVANTDHHGVVVPLQILSP